MAYSKKNYKKKYYKKKAQVSDSVKSYVKKAISRDVENKYLDTSFLAQGSSWAGSLSSLAHPDQGLTSSNRIGDVIRPVSLSIRFLVKIASSTSAVGRIIIFQWRPQTTPSISSVLQSAYASTENHVNAPYDVDQQPQFKILYDKRIALSTNGDYITQWHKVLSRKKMLNITFTGSTGSGAGSNKLYCIYMDSNNPALLWSMVMRLEYEDS